MPLRSVAASANGNSAPALWLKGDFHTHTAGDRQDNPLYSAEMLISEVARHGIDVLAITSHDVRIYTERLAEFARRRGVLLVPGVEIRVDGRHVVVLNPTPEHTRVTTFAELRSLGKHDSVIVAPHPFFPTPESLGQRLIEHIDIFDAIEYCSVYYAFANFNRRAVRVANLFGLPMLGTSDNHTLPYAANVFTRVEATPTIEGVISAIREGRVSVSAHPRGLGDLSNSMGLALDALRRKVAGQ